MNVFNARVRRWRCTMALGLISLAMTSPASWAGDSAPAKTVPLHDLLRQALHQNAGLAAAALNAQAQSLRIDSADDLADPQFMYGLAPRSLTLEDGDEGHVFGLSQKVPWPGKRRQQRQFASSRAQNAAQLQSASARSIALQTRQAYADWFRLSRELADNAEHEAHLKLLESSLRQALASGRADQKATIHTQLRVLDSQRRASELQAALKQTLARLNALRQSAEPLTTEAPGLLPLPLALPDAQQLTQALREHPSYQQLQAQIDASAAQLALSRLERYPDPKLQIQHFGVRPREEYRTQLSISFDLPFNQQRRDAEIAARTAERQALIAQQRELEAQLIMQLETALASWQAASENWKRYQNEWLPKAEQQVEVARAQFSAARGAITPLIDAEHDLLNARSASVREQSKAFKAYSEILWLSGEESSLGEE